jgi:hypothetical protein
VGLTTQLTATPRDANGNVLTGRTVTWVSSSPGVATVSATGLVTALVLGTTTITATCDTRTAQAQITVVLVPVASVTVSPASLGMSLTETAQLTAVLRDGSGNVLTGRVVTWSSNASTVVSVDNAGLVRANAVGVAVITATSETRSGVANITVLTAGAGEPVYSASNPDHVLHVFENWSTHTTVNDIGARNRSDGGPPWADAGIRRYGQIVNQPDPFGSVKYVTSDQATDPPIPPHGTGAHAAGYHWYGGGSPANGYQGDLYNAQGDDNAVGGGKNNRGFILPPNAYLNKPSKASVVYEWAVRMRGTNWAEGKDFDINAGNGHGVGRFNVDIQWPAPGWTQTCTDPLCRTYYNGCYTPIRPGLPPDCYVTVRQINRDNLDLSPIIGAATIHYKQNMNYGSGVGQFSNGGAQLAGGMANANTEGTFTPMWQAGWLLYKLRLTKPAPGQGFGNGRVEMWIKTPTRTVKIMEYIGDVGQRDAGNVYVAPSSLDELLAGQIGVYELLSRTYTGGASGVDLGMIRIWSHSRQ